MKEIKEGGRIKERKQETGRKESPQDLFIPVLQIRILRFREVK